MPSNRKRRIRQLMAESQTSYQAVINSLENRGGRAAGSQAPSSGTRSGRGSAARSSRSSWRSLLSFRPSLALLELRLEETPQN